MITKYWRVKNNIHFFKHKGLLFFIRFGFYKINQ